MKLLILLIIILLLPLPVKLKLNFKNQKLKIFIYNFELNSKKKYISKEDLEKKKKKKMEKKVKKKKFKLNISNLLKDLTHLKLKLNLKTSGKIYYSTGDAFKTATSFGVLQNFNVFISQILNIFFNIKKHDLIIVPKYDKASVDITLETKIIFTLYKIIYILFKIIKNISIKKENSNG